MSVTCVSRGLPPNRSEPSFLRTCSAGPELASSPGPSIRSTSHGQAASYEAYPVVFAHQPYFMVKGLGEPAGYTHSRSSRTVAAVNRAAPAPIRRPPPHRHKDRASIVPTVARIHPTEERELEHQETDQDAAGPYSFFPSRPSLWTFVSFKSTSPRIPTPLLLNESTSTTPQP